MNKSQICLLSTIATLLGALPFQAFSQNKVDTIYYNANWKKSSRENASYYRILVKDSSRYKVEDYFISGNIQMRGYLTSLDPDIKEGNIKYYLPDGSLEKEELYKNGRRDGLSKSYFEDGKIHSTSNYNKGKLDGEFTTYYRDGKIKRKDIYKDSVLVTGTCYAESGKKMKYYPYQQQPIFSKNIGTYLSKAIKYPKKEMDANKSGTVYLSFIVEKDGSVSTVKVIRGVTGCPDFDEEGIRVISSMPKWKAGMQDGEPVRVSFNIPIRFILN